MRALEDSLAKAADERDQYREFCEEFVTLTAKLGFVRPIGASGADCSAEALLILARKGLAAVVAACRLEQPLVQEPWPPRVCDSGAAVQQKDGRTSIALHIPERLKAWTPHTSALAGGDQAEGAEFTAAEVESECTTTLQSQRSLASQARAVNSAHSASYFGQTPQGSALASLLGSAAVGSAQGSECCGADVAMGAGARSIAGASDFAIAPNKWSSTDDIAVFDQLFQSLKAEPFVATGAFPSDVATLHGEGAAPACPGGTRASSSQPDETDACSSRSSLGVFAPRPARPPSKAAAESVYSRDSESLAAFGAAPAASEPVDSWDYGMPSKRRVNHSLGGVPWLSSPEAEGRDTRGCGEGVRWPPQELEVPGAADAEEEGLADAGA